MKDTAATDRGSAEIAYNDIGVFNRFEGDAISIEETYWIDCSKVV
ncbi:hypothetical protein [uncultured Roseobacter sp.]|nr:hypothetical protein [uncultured Roseobacter sp.]